MIERRTESETVITLAGVGLNQIAFKLMRNRGFTIKETVINVTAPVFAALVAAVGKEEKQTLSITTISNTGEASQSVEKTYAVLVTSMFENSDHSGVITLHDSRIILERAVMPRDINVKAAILPTGLTKYELNSIVSENNLPDTLGIFIDFLQPALNDKGYDVEFNVSDAVFERNLGLRDDIFVARKSVLPSLRSIFAELSLSIFADSEGVIQIVDATPTADAAREALSAVKFKTKPQWTKDNYERLGVPQKIIGLYTRMRQYGIAFGDADEVDQSSTEEAILSMPANQVYMGKDEAYVDLTGLLKGYSRKFADFERPLTDENIEENLIVGNWTESPIQQTFTEPVPQTDLIDNFTESLRVALSLQLLPTIMSDWRMLFRIDLWDYPGPPKEWRFGRFGDKGKFENSAVKANYVDFLVKPVVDPSQQSAVADISIIRRTQSYDFGDAPFNVSWDGQRGLERGVMRLTPQAGQNVRDRRPGALTSEDVLTRIDATVHGNGEFQNKVQSIVWASNSGNDEPKFDEFFFVEVSVVSPDRLLYDDDDPYSGFHKVEVEGIEGGDVPTYHVQMDDKVTANFREVGDDPLNQEELDADMERRASVVRSFFNQRAGGSAKAHALQTHDLLVEQAILEANIEVHIEGPGVVMTEIVLGGTIERTSGVQKTNKRQVFTAQRDQSNSTITVTEPEAVAGEPQI